MKQGEKMHPYVPELAEKLRTGEVSRREFLRMATLLGMSFGAAQFLAACAQPTAAPTKAPPAAAPTQPPAPTATPVPAVTGPVRGGTLKVAGRVQKVTHPAQLSWVSASNQLRQVAEYLTVIDGNNITHPYLWRAGKPAMTLRPGR